jgi:hypothetical protein
MKAKLLLAMQHHPETSEQHARFKSHAELPQRPAGTVIDHPDAFRLVQMGCAEPADMKALYGECAQHVGVKREEVDSLAKNSEETPAG